MLLIVITFAFFGMFGKLGETELQPIGSATYASIAREMLRTGDLLTLHWPHNEEFKDYYHHPPLFFWLQSSVFRLFGANDLTARLVSSFFGFLLIVLVFYFGKLLSDDYLGFLSALTLILTPFFFKHSRKCELESIFIFFITLSFFFFALAQKSIQPKYYVLMGISAGLAFLSKGIPAGAIFVAIFLYLLFTKRWKTLFDKWFILGIISSFLVVGIWLIPQFIFKGDTFYKKYFVEQVLWKIKGGDRVSSSSIFNNFSGITFYFKVFFSRFLPWSLTALWGVAHTIKAKDSKFYILFFWIITSLIGFTSAGYKEDYYLLIFWPAVCIMNGMAFKIWTESVKSRVVYFIFGLLAVFLVVVFFTPVKFSKVRNPEIKILGSYINRLVPKDERVIIYKMYYWDMASLFPWYADRGVTHSVESSEELKNIMMAGGQKFLFIKNEDLNILPKDTRKLIYPIYVCGRFTLASNKYTAKEKILKCK